MPRLKLEFRFSFKLGAKEALSHTLPLPSPEQTFPPPLYLMVCDSGKVRQAYTDLPREMDTNESNETKHRSGTENGGESTVEVFQRIVEEENEKIDAGEYECPACGFEVGTIVSVSCSQCGHIPEEHRA